ncbi:hypothetical protein H5410_056671 [Solanum commersonii]|uniref:Uncharacterized protein n=1 Tax=Solanum commersonii TaxID=4109 RepID=A0A9J5WKW0_SOLCO|nr:hypothetical protein H5410_056671 [Solanum commersonii]
MSKNSIFFSKIKFLDTNLTIQTRPLGVVSVSAICPLVWFIIFPLLPLASSRFESLGDMVLLHGTGFNTLEWPFNDSLNALGDPQTFISLLF